MWNRSVASFAAPSCNVLALPNDGPVSALMETHQDSDRASADGPNMVRLKDMPALLAALQEFDRLAKRREAQQGKIHLKSMRQASATT
jgi:3-deoxy-D-manno-octulosonic acid (KDO) 8-phosphate synthase